MHTTRIGLDTMRKSLIGVILALAFVVRGAPGLAQSPDDLPDRAAFEQFQAILDGGALSPAAVAELLVFDDTPEMRLELARLSVEQGQHSLALDLLGDMNAILPLEAALRTQVLDLLIEANMRLGNVSEAIEMAFLAYEAAVQRLGDENPALLPRLLVLRDLVKGSADLPVIEAEIAALEARLAAPEGVRQIGKPHALPVWFGTNRNDTGVSDPAARFGVELSDLSLGQLTVTIPQSHRPGRIERPALWGLTQHLDPMQHVVLAQIEALAKEAFSTDCCGAEDRLLFIHGYNVSFHDGALRAAQLAHDLEFPGQALYYSWPSRGTLLSYLQDANNVLATRPALAEFLEIVTRGTGRLHVIAHSMGNRYLLEALDVFLRDFPDRELGHIVLGAPDVDRNEMQVRLDLISKRARSVSLYASRNDRALLVSRRIHGAPRAGDSTGEPLRLAGVFTLDASEIVADVLGHSYFGDSPLVLGDLAGLLRLDMEPDIRCGTRERAAPVWDIRTDGCPVDHVLAAAEFHDRYQAQAPTELARRIAEAEQTEQAFWLSVMEIVTENLGNATAPAE